MKLIKFPSLQKWTQKIGDNKIIIEFDTAVKNGGRSLSLMKSGQITATVQGGGVESFFDWVRSRRLSA